MSIKKVRATQVVCDDCHSIQVVTDPMDIVGFSGIVCQQGDWGGTGSIKWFACQESCIRLAVVNSIKEAYENR